MKNSNAFNNRSILLQLLWISFLALRAFKRPSNTLCDIPTPVLFRHVKTDSARF